VKDCDKYPPIVVTGNKCDLEEKREVAEEEGKSFAAARRIPFFETSGKTSHNIDLAFLGNNWLLSLRIPC